MQATPYSRQDIELLVHDFYHHIQQHPDLGPIFNTHIHNWPDHLATMVTFWSSLLLKTGDFTGSPMMKHAAIAQLRADLFESWLKLFKARCEQHPNAELGKDAWAFATRIARSLWMGYQIQHNPTSSPSELSIPNDYETKSQQ